MTDIEELKKEIAELKETMENNGNGMHSKGWKRFGVTIFLLGTVSIGVMIGAPIPEWLVLLASSAFAFWFGGHQQQIK